jgi:hypothetical protein
MKESLITKLYDATNKGLDIILHYYPQARECISGNSKFFKVRTGERTPSATLKLLKDVWKVTDFGDEGSALNPIEVAMKEERLEFREALHRLCDRYNVTATVISQSNKSEVEARPAKDDEPEGDFKFELNEKISDFELSVLGPMVKEETCQKYSYFSIKWYRITKNRKTTTVKSTETYPIFMRDCGEFRKIYQPLNPDKAFRFFYNGNKPKEFINGLKELKKRYEEYTKEIDEDTEYGDDEGMVMSDETKETNYDNKKKSRKLPEAIFCSGERDALNVAGMGYLPLWLNSETAKVSKFEMANILKMVDQVYNIPDTDETGLKKAMEFALEHIEVFTVELPNWLPKYKDARGKPRKDLRDFLDIKNSRKEFENLLSIAKPVKFWETKYIKNEKRVEINTVFFLHFLKYNNFGKITDKDTGYITYCRIKGHKIEKIMSGKTIRNFVLDYLNDNYVNVEVQNLFINSTKTSINVLDNMPDFCINFKDYTINSQMLFFENCAINVFKDKIEEVRGDSISSKVWESDVSKYRFKRIDPSIICTYDTEKNKYEIEIKHTQSHYFRFLINTSRIYWREELEYRRLDKENSNEIDDKYATDNKFSIYGARLTDEEIEEQCMHLINKMYVIGYLLHGYKSYAKALSVWLMENKVTDESESSGGSGKSLMIKFLKNLCNIVTLPGRDKELTKRQFFMDRVTEYTDIINVEDATKYFDFNAFYSFITGDMQITKKFEGSKEIDYKTSAKLVITSNFPPHEDDGSTMRRMLLCVFSDYYHHQTSKNDYTEHRRVYDDFGYELYNDLYKEEWWNEDFNFCVDCLQFYLYTLENNLIVQPPMAKVNERISLAQIGENFKNWADVYFANESENLDKLIPRKDVFNDYCDTTGDKKTRDNTFKKKLHIWVRTKQYIECINPKQLQNDKEGRIIRKEAGKTMEFYYIQSKGAQIIDTEDNFNKI